MANDVATPSNPPIALIEQELEEAPFDVIVFQQPCKEKIAQASDTHSSRLFGMGSSIVS
jgi:hypothetical protein